MMTNPKPWLWLLVASLALNVFLGVSAGTHFFRGPRGHHPPRPEHMLLDMASRMPEADARILRQALENHRAQLDATEKLRAGPEQMRQAMSAEPFDVEAFRRTVSEFHAKRTEIESIIDDILAETLPQLSAEGRKAMAAGPPGPPGPPPPR